MGQAHCPRGGRQWLANLGKTDSGVVSVTSLLADEKLSTGLLPLSLIPRRTTSRAAKRTRSSAPS
jgi:hypothetical protein